MADGLRERKKQEVRDSLSLATVLLASERGLANVRVEDVVAQVGVSRRTFSNYFASKEDAIADRHVRRAERAAHALGRRPAEEPLWAAVTAVILEQYALTFGSAHEQPRGDRDELFAALSDPAMQASVARGSQVAADAFALAVAARLGSDAATDVLPRLVANAAVTTPMLVIGIWLQTKPSIGLRALMSEAFAQIGTGLDHLATVTADATSRTDQATAV